MAELEGDTSKRDPEQASLNQNVEPYSIKKIDQRVIIRQTDHKGRILIGKFDFKPGDVIFSEAPLLSVTKDLDKKLWKIVSKALSEIDASLPVSWHFAALHTILNTNERTIQKILDKWHPYISESAPRAADCVHIVESLNQLGYEVDVYMYENMLSAWRFNCFGHHSDNQGLVLYHRVSMMAHSCDPNATWHYGDSEDFVLKAMKHIPAGSEICISYIGEDDLKKSTPFRRSWLQNWEFTCMCKACTDVVDRRRGIRCSSCGAGVVYFTEAVDGTNTATICNCCDYEFTMEEMERYLTLEEAYQDRLTQTRQFDIEDAEYVLVEAKRVMKSHWILHEYHSILAEGYKLLDDWQGVAYHLSEKLAFMQQVATCPCFAQAVLHEEYGDAILYSQLQTDAKIQGSNLDFKIWENYDESNWKLKGMPSLKLSVRNQVVRQYETAMNMMIASRGDRHTYTSIAHWKLELIAEITASDAPALKELFATNTNAAEPAAPDKKVDV